MDEKLTRREEERAKRIYDFLAGRGFTNLDKISKGTDGFKDLADPAKVPPVRTLTGSINFYMTGKFPGDKYPPRIQNLINRYGIREPHDMYMMKLSNKAKRDRFRKRVPGQDVKDLDRSAEDEIQDKAIDKSRKEGYSWDDVIEPSSGARSYSISEMKDQLLNAHMATYNSQGFPRGDRFRTEFERLGREINGMTPEQIMFLFGEYSRDNFYEAISIYGSRGDGINTNGMFIIKEAISKAMSV